MNPKVIALIICGVVVLGLAYLVVDHDRDDGPSFDKTGSWYCFDFDSVQWEDATSDPTYDTQDYSLSEKKHPFVIEKRTENTFVGTFDGIKVLGGLIGNSLCFELKDPQHDAYYYVEGLFNGKALTLAIVYYKDEGLTDVIGGRFMAYTHESSNLPIMPSVPAETVKILENGSSEYYYIGDNGKIAMKEMEASVTYLSDGNSGSYANAITTSFEGKLVRNLSVAKGTSSYGYLWLFAGDTFDVGDDTTYRGGTYLENNKLNSYLYVNSINNIKRNGILHTCYDVRGEEGELIEPADISGKWVGKSYRFDGKKLTDDADVVKDISVKNSVFTCVENVVVDGETVSYKWFGTIHRNALFINAESHGMIYSLCGYVSGDTIHLCGFVEISKGKFIGVGMTLHRAS